MKTPRSRKISSLVLVLALIMTFTPYSTTADEMAGVSGAYRSEMRNALSTIAAIIRAVADKLERHELRERQLGDQLRRGQQTFEKRQATTIESISKFTGVVTDVIEEYNVIKTMIRMNTETILHRIERLEDRRHREEVEQLKECQVDLKALNKANADTVKEKNIQEANTVHWAATELAAAEQRVRAAAASTEAVLLTYRKRLDTYHSPEAENDWHSLFLGALKAQGNELKDLTKSTKTATNIHQEVAETALNEMLRAISAARSHLSKDVEKVAERLGREMEEAGAQRRSDRELVLRALNDQAEQLDKNADKQMTAYEEIHGQVLALRSAEKVLIQTADNVLDTKRGVEYGVYQILQETGEVVKAQAKLLNATLHQRFDGISETILEHQTGALTNLSTKIEAEISQVWRQIGIMYQQLTASASALDRLQEQTESYVNGSAAAMDSMEGKVGAIRERMNEVDDNLNYLLGRLSLFSNEFGQVRTGLAEALDDIRKTFEEAQVAIANTKAQKVPLGPKGPTFAVPPKIPPPHVPKDE